MITQLKIEFDLYNFQGEREAMYHSTLFYKIKEKEGVKLKKKRSECKKRLKVKWLDMKGRFFIGTSYYYSIISTKYLLVNKYQFLLQIFNGIFFPSFFYFECVNRKVYLKILS